MKYRALAILHLIVLAIYIVRPILPYIEYAINKDYIAKNLCVNRDKPKSCCEGKCYLEKQIKKNSEPEESKEKNRTKKAEVKEINQFLSASDLVQLTTAAYIKLLNKPETPVSTRYLSSIFIPPEV
ncbi:MAG: hypothetical protein PHV20_08260 [Bacteroidales bacterium]|nr:hypothetical protein [Bacteroidales bacterium]